MAEVRNVLFVLADQFRVDCLGVAGNGVIQTPHLDELAREGVRFTKYLVQSSPCGPSPLSFHARAEARSSTGSSRARLP